MNVYLFRDPGDKATMAAFLSEATLRSLKALRAFAFVAIGWCAAAIVAAFFLPPNFVVDNEAEFLGNQVAGLINALLFVFFYEIIKRRIARGQWKGSRLLINLFSFIVILHFLIASFLAQKNPGNTITFFMLGSIMVAMIVLMRHRELLTVLSSIFIVLVVMMPIFQPDQQKVVQSYVGGFFVLLIAYVVSRIWFSMQYNQFLQLQTIARKNEEINKINTLQTDMLAIVAHDLRAPINSIAAAIEFLEEGVSTPEDIRQFYHMIRGACREADHFIHDLIDVARNQDGSPLQTSAVDLGATLRDIADAWRRQAGPAKQIQVVAPSHPVTAEVHDQKMQRVLNNLIHNAVKFTAEDGIIKLMLNANEEMIHIAVSDNGIGVPEALLPDIFDRFTQAGRQGLKGEKSYGLGLSICQQIVLQHRGSIRAESSEKRGTTFHIILPRNAHVMHLQEDPSVPAAI
jgi:two-component system sensor histidine kinase VicK